MPSMIDITNMLQNIVMPSALIAVVAIIAAAPLFYMFTVSLPWGLTGAAVALNLADAFGMFAIIIWSIVIVKKAPPGDKKGESWQGFTSEAFQVTLFTTSPSTALIDSFERPPQNAKHRQVQTMQPMSLCVWLWLFRSMKGKFQRPCVLCRTGVPTYHLALGQP